MPAFPTQNVNQFYMLIYGGYGYDGCGWGASGFYGCQCSAYLGLASGIPQTGNPPYTVNDFLATYPKFFGSPTLVPAITVDSSATVSGIPNPAGLQAGQLVSCQTVNFGTVITEVQTSPIGFTGDVTENSQVVANVSSTAGLIIGQPIAGAGIPSGATIVSIGAGTISISTPATSTNAATALTATATSLVLSSVPTSTGSVTLAVYTAQLVPLAVIQLYLNLAFVSLMVFRWRERWIIGMGLFIAHFCFLWCQTEGNPQSTASQVVANSLQAGVTISQGADGVTQGLKPLEALDNWAAWTLSSYGAQLATFARVVGAGAVYWRG